MHISVMFALDPPTGQRSFTGTDLIQEAGSFGIGDTSNDFFVGQIENVSDVSAQIELVGFGGLSQRFRLRPNEAIRVQGSPLSQVRVFVNGTVTLRVTGTIITADTIEEANMLLTQANIIERAASTASVFSFPTYDHTDIAAATTTTIATPAAGLSIRVYKITVSVQGANRVELRWTDSDGTSNPNAIGVINFTAEGTFVYDFGDNGILIPNGIDGLLRAITSQAAVADIDVISEDV